ncbi:alpha/beta hydrolase [Frondihabitans sp. PAMC 28766]|uniref:alpha/beta hydrolase n=1 Tax=Frondihabitans sp. PAMC 28766 TaxID=1795630 RepID=UPI00078D8B7E|nr:alpha/beta hydrolase [Frondihabitans sp. PAMC 28766]AMM18890.1 alpha/beta hydrolase [Frondihabitans sp. PAMC 28766]
MTAEQRHTLAEMLRTGPLDFEADLDSQRAIFTEMLTGHPNPDDVRTTDIVLGGVPAIDVTVDGASASSDDVVFYLHGGAYVMGSAAGSVGLASDIARRSGARVVTVDYRLAPEHPYPAALDDAVAAYEALVSHQDPAHIALVGESAGGGLVFATLVALRERGLPMPRAAVALSPWADLTVSGSTAVSKADVDVSVSVPGLRLRAGQYIGDADPRTATLSPVFADLHDLPPVLIQSGSNEVLLDDSLRLAAAAAIADVAVRLEVTPGAPHVFQAFAAILTEGDAALESVAAFLRAALESTVES